MHGRVKRRDRVRGGNASDFLSHIAALGVSEGTWPMRVIGMDRDVMTRQEFQHSRSPTAGRTSLMRYNQGLTASDRPSLTFRGLNCCDACGGMMNPWDRVSGLWRACDQRSPKRSRPTRPLGGDPHETGT